MERLISVLESMVTEHTELYELAQTKTEIIKNGDIKGLDRVLVKEEALASRIGQLENTRLKLVTEFLNLPQEETSFTRLIEQASEPYKEKLETIQLKLMSLVFDLKYQNDLNQSLLKQSLDWVYLNMSLLKPQVKSVTYSGKNRQKPALDFFNSKSSFDSQA
jgi:flagellar biosynthesis/type III secretory pathway chaperone